MKLEHAKQRQLKLVIKSLEHEANLTRAEELRWPRHQRGRLHHHRTVTLRKRSRAAQLAYGFIRGRDYRTMEPILHDAPDWGLVLAMIYRYTDLRERELMQRFWSWIDGAYLRHLAPNALDVGVASVKQSAMRREVMSPAED